MNRKQSSATRLRLRASVVLVGVIALLGVALYLDPARLEKTDSGYPFLKPCGFLHTYGYPCPTCFMTRSFSYMMHGHPGKSFLAQPFGAMLCLLVIYLGWGALRVLYTGQPWNPFWTRYAKKWIVVVLVGAFFGGWIFKLLYGTFITGEFPLK